MSRKRSYRRSFRRNKLTLGSFCMYWKGFIMRNNNNLLHGSVYLLMIFFIGVFIYININNN